MSSIKYCLALKNAQQDLITTQVGANGFLNYYDGAQPASPDTAVTTQKLLVHAPLPASLAAAAAAGVLTANAIADAAGTAAAAAGITATWWSLTKNDGTRIVDGALTITGGGGDITIDNPNIAQNQPVSFTSLTLTNSN